MTAQSRYREHRFPESPALVHALASEIKVDLSEAIAARGAASLVVPGGTTPAALFAQLSQESVDWNNVWITLSDERWVDISTEQSNEYLVRTTLLKDKAAQAHFVPLKNPAPTPEAGIEWAWRGLTRVPKPYDVVLLGMGEDGHIASLFPSSITVSRALDSTAAAACVAIHGLAAPHARISQNLTALLDARRIMLLITGEKKWSVYQRAKHAGSVTELPVRAILHQHLTPVDVYWSP